MKAAREAPEKRKAKRKLDQHAKHSRKENVLGRSASSKKKKPRLRDGTSS